MTPVPTPSDSQDGARRRDDAALTAAVAQALRDDVDPELESCFEGADREDECFRAHIHLGSSIGGVIRTVYANPDRVAELAALALRPHFEDLRADVARLEAERDEARAELSANERSEDARLAIAEAEREYWKSRCEFAWTRLDEEGGHVLSLFGEKRQVVAERDRMRPVYLAALAWRQNVGPVEPRHEEYFHEYELVLITAVDQTAPSSPQETPQTADGGEAGVVEGAGGSEAAEGEQVAEWEAKAIEDEWARREGVPDRSRFTEAELTALTCRKCGAWLTSWTAEPCDFMNRDGAKYVIAAIRTNQPCGCSWREATRA